MTVTTERSGDIVVIHAGPVRLTYPSLSDFASSVTGELAAGARKLVIDLGKVEYLDSAAVGCLMDLYRQATHAGATYELDIYDLSGRRVQRVDSGIAQAGRFSLQWNLRNAVGRPVEGGVYFARLTVGGTSLKQKFVVLQ